MRFEQYYLECLSHASSGSFCRRMRFRSAMASDMCGAKIPEPDVSAGPYRVVA